MSVGEKELNGISKDGSVQRTTLLRKNIFFSFLIKGWSALMLFLLVPITLKCLGEYQNGVWLTISSLLIWIDNLDIGLGNGLRNKLATYIAKNDMKKAREAVSSAFAMLSVIIIPVCLTLCLLTANIDVYTLLNAEDTILPNLGNVIIICIIFVCSTFIFKFIGNVYMGMQLQAVNTLLQALGQTLTLAGTIVIYLYDSHSLLHIAIVNTASPLIVYLISYPYTFCIKFKELRPSFGFVSKEMSKGLFSVGVVFFIIQISGVILFMSSNLLISHLFSPEMVTPYQIAYRYFYIPFLAFTIVCAPYWSATTDAYERGDMEWISKSNARLNKVVLVVISCIILMALLSAPFYDIWIGTKTSVSNGITIMMAIYMTITIISLRYSYILNGIGALRLQLITTVTAAVLFIPLAIATTNQTHSVTAFMAVMCAVNLPGLIINMIQYNRIINKTAFGIWRK